MICLLAVTLSDIPFIIIAIIALGVVVFAHEWGHFMVGRRMGIRAEAFSIGFGPILWRKTIGETEYRLSAILFGGYVKFAGMEGTKDKKPQEIERGFFAAPPGRRILATFAGPLMNVVLAFFLFFVLWGTGRKMQEGEATTVIGSVLEGAPAEQAGLKPGDRIVSISGRKVDRWMDVMMGVAVGGRTLDVEIERGGSIMHVTVTPREDPKAGARIMGVVPAQEITVYRVEPGTEAERMGLQKGDLLLRLDDVPIYNGPVGWQDALRKRAGQQIALTVERAGNPVTLAGTMPQGVGKEPPILGFDMALVYVTIYEDPLEATAYSFGIVGRTLKALVTRQVKAKGLAGPVGIVGLITYSLRIHFTSFLWWAAFISLNLAVINLLPIPVVDGGHIMFAVVEKVRRKPVKEKTMAVLSNVFAVLIIAFALYVTFNDIRRLVPSGTGDEGEPATEEPAPGKTPPEQPAPDAPGHE
jgi:regulator of sigma E protease